MESKKTAILTSLEPKILATELPKKYCSTPSYTIKGTASKHSCNYFSCNWNDINALFQKYDQVILYEISDTNDQLLQGERKHVLEFLLILFKETAKLHRCGLFLLHQKGLLPLNSIEDHPSVEKNYPDNKKRSYTKASRNTVTSIQKITLKVASSSSADEWVIHYFKWIEQFTKGLIKITMKNNAFSFYARGLKQPLLVLETNDTLQNESITELVIKGGVLNKERDSIHPLGRFFFVQSPGKGDLYTALVHFKPSLPWLIYRISQGVIHQIVMARFSKSITDKK